MPMSKTDPIQIPPREPDTIVSRTTSQLSTLVLDARQRALSGLEMVPLLRGEFALLAFLGIQPFTWHSSRRLSMSVYGRDDLAARQLVWKYASTLRKKLAPVAPGLIEVCRRRGYSCRAQISVVGLDPEQEPSLHCAARHIR